MISPNTVVDSFTLREATDPGTICNKFKIT